MLVDAKLSITKKGYLKEAVLATCVEMQDRGFVFLVNESDDGKYYEVDLSVVKGSNSEESVRSAIDEFKAVLDEKHIKIKLLKNNIKNSEQIAYNALSNPVFFDDGEKESKIPDSIAKILEESADDSDESYLDDPLNIAVPWEERNQ